MERAWPTKKGMNNCEKAIFILDIEFETFFRSFKKMTSRHMNQSSAWARSRCLGNGCWCPAPSLCPCQSLPHTRACGGVVEILQAEHIKVSIFASIKWLWGNGLAMLNPKDLVSKGGVHTFSTPSLLVKSNREHRGKDFQNSQFYLKPSMRLAFQRRQLPLHRQAK